MSERSVDSYCGLFCGACDIRLAGETGRKSRFAAFWDEGTLRRFRERQGTPIVSPEQLRLRCSGCKSDDVFVNCGACQLRACARERLVAHCSDCGEYPCALYEGFRKAASILPHTACCADNLEAIRAAGVARWTADQEERWHCPECGAPFSWYAEACGSCGRNLGDRAFRFSAVRAFVMKLAIRFLPRSAATKR
jgi:hypothetical protein